MTDPFSIYARNLRNGASFAPFAGLEAFCQTVVGHRLFSCSRFHLKNEGGATAARIYTSDEANYPTSGLKEITPNRWTAIVVDSGQSFVANTVADFSDVFPDHALIASLGLGSVVNVPIIVGGEFLGTVNLLHESGFFGPKKLALLGQIETAAQLAFVLEFKSIAPVPTRLR